MSLNAKLICGIATALLAIGISATARASDILKATPQAEGQQQEKFPANVDPKRFERATVVLRARLMRPLGGETGVMWYQMKVIDTLKNNAGRKFGATQNVFTSQRPKPGVPRDPGPPAEECTIYLELITGGTAAKPELLWRLLDGNTASGVSHVKKAE
ncbi:hypothetical protein ETAA8_23750 [Anatilimnocola aggregata]|uniref:Uncharacterized protein n=1 Tax=Anatilimnocola aggregata TaxID=2528021 RepID=A0A517YAN6_9BACT|nr:hypothetical protein [Anatilimnocola aggregata]QDU27288.1 hypothetical protein ETAA8_23750 [Anatilimnocola aggregata]